LCCSFTTGIWYYLHAFFSSGRTLTKKEEEFSNYITEIQLVKSLGYPFLTRSNEEEAEEEKRRDPRPNFSKRGT
jgi:hypothetical protein